MSHKETIDGYGVLIRRDDGTEFFSCSGDAGRSVFYERKAAVVYKRELKEHGIKGRVVPVRATFEVVEPKE
jgi:hypothetical protein